MPVRKASSPEAPAGGQMTQFSPVPVPVADAAPALPDVLPDADPAVVAPVALIVVELVDAVAEEKPPPPPPPPELAHDALHPVAAAVAIPEVADVVALVVVVAVSPVTVVVVDKEAVVPLSAGSDAAPPPDG